MQAVFSPRMEFDKVLMNTIIYQVLQVWLGDGSDG
jgi:hypothetical protein